ncbi:MAG TPA: zinc ABC transporter substrate-binding protein [Methylomirabilota bacterium]|nr:zinc ABC transporter substrate-binding protein [Methylomirabilota bacterium]
MKRAAALAVYLGLATAAAAADPVEPVRVVVTVLPQVEVAERVGGELVEVMSLVPPGALPDTFEVTPKQMARLTDAGLWLRIGIAFEEVLADRIGSLAPQLRVVDGFSAMDRRPIDGGDHSGHDHGTLDPHVWLDPDLVARHAEILADALCAARPGSCPTFRAGLADYRAELEAADRRVAAVLDPHWGAPIFVFHPAYGYFADRYGLDQVPVEASGKVPTGRRLASLVDRARAAGAGALFVQPQYAGGAADAAAQAMGVAVLELDPLAPDLAANLVRMAEAIARSLEGQP